MINSGGWSENRGRRTWLNSKMQYFIDSVDRFVFRRM